MGSNTLRGGVKSYGAMSLVGNWTEDRVAPDFGGLRPSAETEKQIRDMAGACTRAREWGVHVWQVCAHLWGRVPPSLAVDTHTCTRARAATGKSVPAYGGHLLEKMERRHAAGGGGGAEESKEGGAPLHFASIEDRFDYANLINPDKLYPAATWASVTASTHFGKKGGSHLDAGEFSSAYTLAQTRLTGDAAAMTAYRARWMNDGERGARDARFTSVAAESLGAAVDASRRPKGERFLPGTCKAVEVLRDKAVDVWGADAVWVLLRALPARFTLAQLRKGAESVGVALSVDQGKDLWRQLDAADAGVATRDTLADLLLARGLDGDRADVVDVVWKLLTSLGHGTVRGRRCGGRGRGHATCSHQRQQHPHQRQQQCSHCR